jgi:hypothetical protein
MIFERQPSCSTKQLFGNAVSQSGNLSIAGSMACSAVAIDGSHCGRRVTFLSDAPVGPGRLDANPRLPD